MSNLQPTEKLVLIHMYTLKSIGIDASHVVVSSTQLDYTRHGYLKIIKRLIEKGYVVPVKRGYYGLNESNIY